MNTLRVTGWMAAAALAFLLPAGAAAQSANNPQDTQNSNTQNSSMMNSSQGRNEAREMVPARAAITSTLDAKDVKAGETFQAKLANKVRLKNGETLPAGTLLMGKIGTDDMNQQGKSKLALCIDQARLKDGKTIPVKATIVSIYGPGAAEQNDWYPTAAGDQVTNDWNRHVLQVDEIGALSGVDLHSRIASQNSGVLVSTKKDDIKLKPGTELALAIAPENANQESDNNGTGH